MTLLRNFSVTQYQAFTSCKRQWYFGWVKRLPRGSAPALDLGNAIHAGAEERVKTGSLDAVSETIPHPNPTKQIKGEVFPLRRVVQALEPFMPQPGEEFYVEHQLMLPTHVGVPWIGKIDLWRDTRPLMTLTDYKSTSDLRYVKTPAELYQDIQLGTYAEYAFRMAEEAGEPVEAVKAGLVYVCTDVPKKKPPKVVPVYLTFEREHVRGLWDSTKPVLDEMVEVAKATSHEDVEPTTTACTKYGGCPFREKCGLAPTVTSEKHAGLLKALTTKTTETKEKTTMGFLDKIAHKNGTAAPATKPAATKPATQAAKPAATKPVTTAAVKPTMTAAASRPATTKPAATRPGNGAGAKVPTGIIPDDAPPRDEGIEPDEVVEAVAEGAEEEVAAQDEKPKRGRPPGSTKKANGNGAKGLTLLVGCSISKGGAEPVLIEDWFGSVDFELNDIAAEEGKPSWWLLDFAPQKAALAIKVNEKVQAGNMPGVLLVRRGTWYERDVVPLLVPHATMIIEG